MATQAAKRNPMMNATFHKRKHSRGLFNTLGLELEVSSISFFNSNKQKSKTYFSQMIIYQVSLEEGIN